MNIRRVVTGHSNNKAVIMSDGPPPGIFHSRAVPGSASAVLWKTPSAPSVPQGQDNAVAVSPTLLPAVGESRLLLVTFAPDSVMASPDFDAAAAVREQMEAAPDFAKTFEADHPGMHTTDTVDYGVVLDGEVWLELDEGTQVQLKPHDIFVQTGTRHGWRNKSDKPATLMFVMIGASRKGGATKD